MRFSPTAAALVLALHALPLVSCATLKPAAAQPKPVPFKWIKERDEQLLGMTGNGLACAAKYRGIGVRTNWGSGVVVEVAPGGPADRAGIRLDDILLTEGGFILPLDTIVEVRIDRAGQVLTFKVKVSDVCFRQ